jgi:hypothetical protein
MKRSARFILMITGCFLIVGLSGCATVKEMGKGFMGVSTQVLEEKRPNALKKSFVMGYSDCYTKVKEILNTKDKESVIYAEDPGKKLIAIYFSATDTTVVGIFFTQESAISTLIEISSPSIYAKEEIANRIFSGLTPKVIKEIKVDAKEEVVN